MVVSTLAFPWLLAIGGSLLLAELNQMVFDAVPQGPAANRHWPLQVYAWLEQAAKLLLLAVLAVKCHRLVLQPDTRGIGRWVIRFGLRELRYAFWSCVILLAGSLLTLLVMAPLIYLPGDRIPVPGSLWLGLLATLSFLPGLYIFARLGVTLPAIAVGQPMTWADAWRLTRPHQWSIFLVAALLPYLLPIVLGYLVPANADSRWHWASLAGNWLIATLALLILSVVYARLVSERGAVHSGS